MIAVSLVRLAMSLKLNDNVENTFVGDEMQRS